MAILLSDNNGGGRTEIGEKSGDNKFELKIALGKLQSYWTKAPQFSAEFEDDMNYALTQFNTAWRGQVAPDCAKLELFRLALSGNALTYYNFIHATTLDWITVQAKFKNQFMSKKKQAEIRTELDTLHLQVIRSEGDTYRQALDMPIENELIVSNGFRGW